MQTLQRQVVRKLVQLPGPVVRVLARRPELDSQMAVVVALGERLGGLTNRQLGVRRARRRFDASVPIVDAPFLIHVQTEDVFAGAIPIRLYRPPVLPPRSPLIVFFHGGGWVLGNIGAYDRSCRALAARTGFLVASVEYRLAPEHPFPAGVEDAFAAYRWLVERPDVDPKRVAVAGDSAGGNLAAVTARLARDAGIGVPAYQFLIYPGTDLTCAMDSHRRFAFGYYLEKDDIDWFREHYRADTRDPRASPLFEKDLRGLPPALVLTAEFDPLVDEGRAYAKRLAEAGVAVEDRCIPGLVHGFFSMTGVVDAARRAVLAATSTLRDQLLHLAS